MAATVKRRGPKPISPVVRFWAKVDVRDPSECWPWLASFGEHGYGQFNIGTSSTITRRAHRVAWRYFYGRWPTGVLDHRVCDNPPCCNPLHCVDTSLRGNSASMVRKSRHGSQRKERCRAGHEYDRIKTRGDGRTFRACSICSLTSTHRRRGAEKARHTGPRRKYVEVAARTS